MLGIVTISLHVACHVSYLVRIRNEIERLESKDRIDCSQSPPDTERQYRSNVWHETLSEARSTKTVDTHSRAGNGKRLIENGPIKSDRGA